MSASVTVARKEKVGNVVCLACVLSKQAENHLLLARGTLLPELENAFDSTLLLLSSTHIYKDWFRELKRGLRLDNLLDSTITC